MASYHSDHYFKEYGVPSTPLPICMLQLDPADRAVLRIAGMHFNPSAATKIINLKMPSAEVICCFWANAVCCRNVLNGLADDVSAYQVIFGRDLIAAEKLTYSFEKGAILD